jgi:hypothetical protein
VTRADRADPMSGRDCPLIWPKPYSHLPGMDGANHMEADDLTNRWAIRGDPARLTEAAAALRDARAEQIFGARSPGEYVISGIARLLDSLAREMRDNDTVSHDVVSAATEMSEHVLTYLPEIGKRR